ncbi:MAG TPA: hypothetical protein VGK17_23160 [Propionicimonas sp.]
MLHGGPPFAGLARRYSLGYRLGSTSGVIEEPGKLVTVFPLCADTETCFTIFVR